jgi:CRP-like cAMP-binding protein
VSQAQTAALIRKFDSIGELSAADRRGLAGLSGAIRKLGAHEAVVREGDRPAAVTLLLSGFLCRYKVLPDGRRQIMSFHIPGDIPDLQSLHLTTMDHTLAALTASTVALIPHTVVLDFLRLHPEIAALCWRHTLIDAAVFREWMLGIGRRSAYERIAHVFCELFARTRALGLARDDTCDMPVTQADIADALGLSAVHVNRTLQELRADGLVELRNGVLEIENWDGLQRAGEFDPAYLHLKTGRQHDGAREVPLRIDVTPGM